jgi:hypothetical protein
LKWFNTVTDPKRCTVSSQTPSIVSFPSLLVPWTLSVLLVLSVLSGSALGLALVSKCKTLTITPEWVIKGTYTYVFQADSPRDKTEALAFIDQIQRSRHIPETLQVTLQTPGRPVSRYLAGDADSAANRLTPGSSMTVTFTTETVFVGFDALFADYFSIDQPEPVQQADYRVYFPGTVHYQVRIQQDGKTFQDQVTENQFSWSAVHVRDLRIAITTAQSRESIALRYQLLYNRRYGTGLEKHPIPEQITGLATCSNQKKISGVLDFLRRNIRYETRPDPDHILIPDSPPTTLARGWGDCKDAALLGCALLEFLEIDADILLTGKSNGTWTGQLPDPFVYSHAILSVMDNDTVLYFDVTTGEQAPEPSQDILSLSLKVPDTL